jgi:hypothetical protein
VARECWSARAGRVGILVGVWKLGTAWTSAGWRALAPRTKDPRHRQVRGTDCCQRIVVCAGACHVAGCRLQGSGRSCPSPSASGGLQDDSARPVTTTIRKQSARCWLMARGGHASPGKPWKADEDPQPQGCHLGTPATIAGLADMAAPPHACSGGTGRRKVKPVRTCMSSRAHRFATCSLQDAAASEPTSVRRLHAQLQVVL